MKHGLVLEGGAMRGVFTAGILDVFLEQNVQFDVCYGVSAGACLACSHLCCQKGRGYAVMTDYLDNKDYCSLSSLIRTGDLFGAEFLYHTIPEKLYPIDNEAFQKNSTEFHCVVTNCITGRAEYPIVSDMFSDVDLIRASSSLPLVSRMVEINDNKYLDGGIADPIPVQEAIAQGCDRVIVILTRERSFRKEREKTLLLIRMKYRNYPNLIKAMELRHEAYNASLDLISRLEQKDSVFVLAPTESLNIRRTEKDRQILQRGYDTGRDLALSQMDRIREFLAP